MSNLQTIQQIVFSMNASIEELQHTSKVHKDLITSLQTTQLGLVKGEHEIKSVDVINNQNTAGWLEPVYGEITGLNKNTFATFNCTWSCWRRTTPGLAQGFLYLKVGTEGEYQQIGKETLYLNYGGMHMEINGTFSHYFSEADIEKGNIWVKMSVGSLDKKDNDVITDNNDYFNCTVTYGSSTSII
jgi:hypothetical protein